MSLSLRPVFAASVLFLVACAAPDLEPAESGEEALISDVKSITANGDGTFTVVCKDDSVEHNVPASKILANEVCNTAPPPPPPPPPPTSWSQAKHLYNGKIYAVTSDDKFAFVRFTGVGLGRFDLTTYTLTHSFGNIAEYTDQMIYVRGTKIIMLKPRAVPGTTAMGLEVTFRDLADPTFVRTVERSPTPGAGHLIGSSPNICNDGRAEWYESGTRVRGTVTGATVTVGPSPGWLDCSSEPSFVAPYATEPKKRTDVAFANGAVQTCANGTCTNVRTMPSGTSWVVFSKTGKWIAYEANGFVYRDKIEGGATTELPNVSYQRNLRDGKLVSTTSIFDIESNTTTTLAAPISTSHSLRYLANGMTAFHMNQGGYRTLLVSDANESVVLDTFLLDYAMRRPGLGDDYEERWIL